MPKLEVSPNYSTIYTLAIHCLNNARFDPPSYDVVAID